MNTLNEIKKLNTTIDGLEKVIAGKESMFMAPCPGDEKNMIGVMGLDDAQFMAMDLGRFIDTDLDPAIIAEGCKGNVLDALFATKSRIEKIMEK